MPQISKRELYVPPLSEAVEVLQKGLQNLYEDISVKAIQCPDLTQSPFGLAAPGLCGNRKIVDVGGVKNLLPLANKSKSYSLQEIAKAIDAESSLCIGAGAGPFHELGRNSELIANIKFNGDNKPACNLGFTAKTTDEDPPRQILEEHKSSNFGILGNFFFTKGEEGRVIEIRAKRRTNKDDLITSIHTLLSSTWNDKSVGLGGVVAVCEGKSRIHVMPDFSDTPLNSSEEVDKWLEFFEVGSPFISVGVMVTNSPPELDVRPVHFHGLNRQKREGGHFHNDTTADEVLYHAVLSIGEEFIRYDQKN